MRPHSRPDEPKSPVLLSVRNLSKHYVRGVPWRKGERVVALAGVDLDIGRSQTLALIGSSGSGKSTLARCITRLERPDSGQINLEGIDIARLGFRELLPFRSKMQMIFQDAATAINPRFTAAEVIEEPLFIRGDNRGQRRDLAGHLMTEVGLSPDWLDRRAMEFSGGQRQRLAIARALILRPELLVLDEALSGLDLSIATQIANLLLDLQAAHRLTYLFISHDVALAARLADNVAVMSNGLLVEAGPAPEILAGPKHPETIKLVKAASIAQARFRKTAGASA